MIRRLPTAIFIAALIAATAAARSTRSVVAGDLFDDEPKRPVVACTAVELDRLRAAARQPAVRNTITQADKFLKGAVAYPTRGGQHNQWYQCENCQLGLKTLSPTEHQCPRCSRIYSGEPYDDVIFKQVHQKNLAGMQHCAWAYAITSDHKYAERGIDVLTGYADRYLKLPYHSANRAELQGKHVASGGHIDEQTLGEAMILSRQVGPAYDLLYAAMTLEQRRHIRGNLIVPMLENLAKHNCGKGNWQTWHNAAMIVGGAAIGDRAWVERAITDPDHGFFFQMDASVTDDGMWYENSWGYHFYTLMAVVDIVEAARRLDIDLWSHPRLKRMFTLPAHYAMPGGALPRFGDDVSSKVRGAAVLSEAAYHAGKDPALLPLLADKPSWHSILYGRDVSVRADAESKIGSDVFPAAGHAILRTNGPGRLAAAVTFGPYGGFHGHLDKLSFVLYGHERELGVDPGRAASQAYRLPIHTEWYKATIGHNAVLVDHGSQKPATGRLLSFGSNDRYAAAVVACDDCWEGVAYRRALILTPDCLVVWDLLAADGGEHTFEWLYHNRAETVECNATPEPIDVTDRGKGFQYLQNTRGTHGNGRMTVRFHDKDLETHVIAAEAADTGLVIGDGPCASVLERVPMMLLSQRGRRAQFAAVIIPTLRDQPPAYEEVRLVDDGDESRLALTKDGRELLIIALRGNARIRITDPDSRPVLETLIEEQRELP